MLDRLFKKKPTASEISILLLQREIDRFSTDTLNTAMQRAWRKPYDPQQFCATSLDGEGAVIKAVGSYFSLLHFDHRLIASELGDKELPQWALHNAHSRLEYTCPGGVPEGELRNRMYGFLGLLCAELVSDKTCGLFFTEECILLPNTPALLRLLRSGQDIRAIV